MRRIFVYGTLLRGERNHYLLGSSRFLGESRTTEGFELRDMGEFPAMVRAAKEPDETGSPNVESVGAGSVVGELYSVEPEVLSALDSLEDHPDLFVRTSIYLASGEEAEAYLLPVEKAAGKPRIAEGDWRDRVG